MLQYLVNTTMIWLLSLLVFHIFMQKESYHGYNRMYLLLTFLLGIFLPLVHWQDDVIIHHTVAAQPIATVINKKQALIQATTIEAANVIDWAQWIWLVYYAGVAVTTLLLIKDVIILGKYFKSGRKYKDGAWQIVETGKQHGPFSAFRYIFISSKTDYSPAELRMILVHEKQHGLSLHFIDILIMEAGKIVFWFHPFVYLFQKKLMMLHEYQADAAVASAPNEYGRFLIRQSMLQNAPPLSHSLNRSPINKRIVMLTRTSSFKAGFKRLITVPLCIICVFLFTKNAISKNYEKTGDKFYYKGNVFELKPRKLVPPHVANSAQYNIWLLTTGVPDTIMAQNPRTGDMEMVIPVIDTCVAKMNDRNIFTTEYLSKAERDEMARTTIAEINNFLLERLAPVINKLNNGYYRLYDYLVIDEQGKIVYIHQSPSDSESNSPGTKELIKALQKEVLESTVNAERTFTPVKHSGKTEIIQLGRQALHIHNQKATIIEPGC